MTEETTDVTQTEEPSLEDVYKTLEPETTQTTTATPAPQVTPQPTYTPSPVPDAYDQDAFKSYMAKQELGLAATQDVVRRLAESYTQRQQMDAQSALQKDLDKAVETVNSKVGHPNPKVIEAMLDAEARSDSRFKSVWDNRGKNPDAWNRAVQAFSNKAIKAFDFKVDPALADAQRARKLAQSKMATTDAPQNEVEKWESMNVEEQQREMDRMLNANM